MPRWKNLSLLAILAIIFVFIPAFLSPQPAAASADLSCGKGEAIWFYRSCTPGGSGTIATWTVDLNPAVNNQTSLNLQVGNAYPGYQLTCELFFANSGRLKIWAKDVTVYNPNSGDLLLSAAVPREEQGKILKSCGFKPTWGKSPTSVPSTCWSKIKLTLTIGPNVQENSRLDFTVRVRLEEKPDDPH